MSVRIDQEVLEIAAKGVSAAGSGAGKVRADQAALLVGAQGAVAGGGNVRTNQLAFLFITPANLAALKVQIIGGPFQDALGNALSNGYLIFQLQHDAVALFAGQVVGNMTVRVPLDVNGFVQGTTTGAPVYIWPNDVLVPSGGTYLVWAYDSVNRLAWDNPQVQQILSTPNPYNLNNWTPGP